MGQAGGENKAFFQIQDSDSPENGNCFFVQFNPKEFKLDESAGWSDGKTADDKQTVETAKDAALTYDKGKPVTVSMDLIFDATDDNGDVHTKWIQPLRSFLSATVPGKDGEGNPTVRPPYCLFKWGSFEMPCVIEKLGVSYLMFTPKGNPLRAKVTVSLKEREDEDLKLSNMQPIVLTAMGSMLSSGTDQAADDPAQIQGQAGEGQHQSNGLGGGATSQTVKANEFKPTKTYVTKEGETLTDVAAATGADYEDIAKANNVDNPLDLAPGTELVIPPSSQMASVFEQSGKSEGPAAWGEIDPNLNGDSDVANQWDSAKSEYSFSEQQAEDLGMEYTPYTSNKQAGVFEHKGASDSFAAALKSKATAEGSTAVTETLLENDAPISVEGAKKQVSDSLS